MRLDTLTRGLLGIGLGVLLCTPATADSVEYYHLDAVGNVLAVTDQTGAVIEEHDYLPFGQEWNPQPGNQPRRFTGKERDAETGLDYFGARYYAPKIGRFTAIDPVYTWRENLLDPQRWNRYAYARNNPLRYVDPDGLRVRVSREGNKIVLTLRVRFVAVREGPNGTQETDPGPRFREWFTRVAEKMWSGTFGKYQVVTRVEEGDDNTIYWVLGSAEVRAGSPDHKQAYDAITWGVPALNRGERVLRSHEDRTLAHEIGHLMYLVDQYNKKTGLPKPGETDIMSDLLRPIEERTIDRLLEGYRSRPRE